MRERLINLCNDRTRLLNQAETALTENRQADYDSAMQQISNCNTEIERVQNLLREQERRMDEVQPAAAEVRDAAEERAAALMRGDAINFTPREIRNAITLATGTLVAPVGAGTDIHDPVGNVASSIVDQVNVVDMTGLSGWQEPYLISDLDAKVGAVATLAGTARTGSSDPSFGVAEIKPYEMNVTAFVDRNISRLSPANYFAKIQSMAMRALRRKLAGLIVNGDAEANHVMYGFKTATNKASSAIYKTVNVSSVDVNLLDTLYFAYGSDEVVGPNARLLLTKADLKAIGQLRGTNEKGRLFTIEPNPANPNTGIIKDGGVSVAYTIVSGLTSLSTASAGAAAIQTMIYGDPMNYMLGLFGDYSIRVDESFEAQKRLLTILGDAMVGGNLTVHEGAVIATVAAATQGGGGSGD